jgi:glyoxylase-like metal-dependent hydrolase (beta-lactamase superfamily II)
MQHRTHYFVFSVLLISFISCKVFDNRLTELDNTIWIHGAADCRNNTDPMIQVFQLNRSTWILRQNKCVHYEAPFMYLFLGSKKALLMDTGATEDEKQFPLYETVRKLIEQWEKEINGDIELIVAHTHSHNDHTAADIQFKNKPGTMVVGLKIDDVKTFFKFQNWPLENSKLDLGGRVIEFIPIPGHEIASVAAYDYKTKLLLAGDSFYPGRLYIEDWKAFKLSIQRLSDFVSKHQVNYILGNHIEMTKTAGKDYPMGTTFQPDEHILPLKANDLFLLDKTLKRLGENPKRESHANFIIYPN